MRQLIFLTLSLVFAQAAIANTEIALPEQIELIAIDGKDLGFRLLNQPDSINLAPGQHVLSLRYKDIFEDYEGGHSVITSMPLYVNFTAVENGQFAITLKAPKSEQDAYRFAKQPSVEIVDIANGTVVNSDQVTESEQQQNWLDNMFEIKRSKLTDTAEIQPAVQSIDHKNLTKTPNSLEMLRYWWQQADSETKQQFIQEISRPN